MESFYAVVRAGFAVEPVPDIQWEHPGKPRGVEVFSREPGDAGVIAIRLEETLIVMKLPDGGNVAHGNQRPCLYSLLGEKSS